MFALLALSAWGANTSSFTPAADWSWPIPAEGYSAGRTSGDLDGDGDDELIVAVDTRIAVFLGSPTGLAAAPDRTFPMTWGAAAAADVNGDGIDDLVVGNPGASGALGAVSVYDGATTGLSAAPSSVHVGSVHYLGLALVAPGDLDSDGYEDLLVAEGDYNAPIWSWWRGSAAGPVRDTFEIDAYVVAAGDVDGDGHAEVFGWDPALDRVSQYPGTPLGPSSVPTWAFTSDPQWITTNDLTGDGLHDLVVFDLVALAGNVSVFAGDPLGLPAVPSSIAQAPGRAGGVFGLGDLGLVVHTGRQAWHHTGLPPATPPWPYPYEVVSAVHIDDQGATIGATAGDFDGDGCDDLVLDAYVAWTASVVPYGVNIDHDAVVGVWYCGTPAQPDSADTGGTADTGTPTTPPDSGTPPAEDTGSRDSPPAPVDGADPEEKAGGCGCASGGPGSWLAAIAALALLGCRRGEERGRLAQRVIAPPLEGR